MYTFTPALVRPSKEAMPLSRNLQIYVYVVFVHWRVVAMKLYCQKNVGNSNPPAALFVVVTAVYVNPGRAEDSTRTGVSGFYPRPSQSHGVKE